VVVGPDELKDKRSADRDFAKAIVALAKARADLRNNKRLHAQGALNDKELGKAEIDVKLAEVKLEVARLLLLKAQKDAQKH
jgi:hypothetical protein